MPLLNLRNAALALVAGVGLSGCASYGPYGGLGVGVGYGSGYGYDPYYGGYGSYGYSPYYNSGYGYSPFGWNNGFYYPGTGYYVYDSYRRPHRWTSAQQRYWLERQRRYRANHRNVEIRDNWQDFRRDRRQDNRAFRVERRNDRVALRNGTVTRQEFRTDRKADRKAYRVERRDDRRQLRRDNRRDRRDRDDD